MGRLISWYIDKNGDRLLGIEDMKAGDATGEGGWAVVNSQGERLLTVTGYSKEARERIERYYEECLKNYCKADRVILPLTTKDCEK